MSKRSIRSKTRSQVALAIAMTLAARSSPYRLANFVGQNLPSRIDLAAVPPGPAPARLGRVQQANGLAGIGQVDGRGQAGEPAAHNGDIGLDRTARETGNRAPAGRWRPTGCRASWAMPEHRSAKRAQRIELSIASDRRHRLVATGAVKKAQSSLEPMRLIGLSVGDDGGL